MRSNIIRTALFVAISVSLHVLFLSMLPMGSLQGGGVTLHNVAVSIVTWRSVKPIHEPALPKRSLPPPPDSRTNQTTQPANPNSAPSRNPTPKGPPAPAALPETAVSSSTGDDNSQAAVVPVRHDTGGTGMTDAKGTNVDVQPPSTPPAPPERKPPPPEPTPPPKTQKPPDVNVGPIRTAYGREVFKRIEAHHIYPQSAKRDGIHGTAVVQFNIGRNGEISSIIIKTTSGFSVLDKRAMETVREASPLPSPPPEIARDNLPFSIHLEFKIDE